MNRKLFWGAILIAHLTCYVWQLFTGNYSLEDSKEYQLAAQNLKDHFDLYAGDINAPLIPDLFSKRPPVYPVFLLLSATPAISLFVQNIVSIFCIWLVMNIGKHLYPAHSIYNFSLLGLFLLSPAQFIYANLIMSEILFQACVLTVVYALLNYHEKRDESYLIIISIALSLAILTKPVAYPLVWLTACAGLFFLIKKRPGIALLAMGPLIIFLAWSLRNQVKTGHFHFSSIEKINLLDYNAYYFLAGQKGYDAANRYIDSVHLKGVGMTYTEAYKFKMKAAKSAIMDDPLSYSAFHFRGMAFFLIDPGRFDFVNFLGIKDGFQGFLESLNDNRAEGSYNFLKGFSPMLIGMMVLALMSNLIKIGGLLLFLKNRHIGLYPKLILFLPVFYLALATGPLGASRFAVPVLPIIVMLAGMELHRWLTSKYTSSQYPS